MKLQRNIYLVAGPEYGVHQNVYAIRADKSVILVDTGTNEREYAVIRANLDTWELGELPVSYVLLTHGHFEHAGNARRFQESGAKIVIGPGDAGAIASGDIRTASYAFAREAAFAACRADVCPEDDGLITMDGVSVRCIHTPGHSPGSVVYLVESDGRRSLFSGDTVLIEENCRRARMGWTGGIDFDRLQCVQSVRKISEIAADALLPGHGQICMKDASELLRDACVRARLTFVHAPVLEF